MTCHRAILSCALFLAAVAAAPRVALNPSANGESASSILAPAGDRGIVATPQCGGGDDTTKKPKS
jgi:hypothetical protein